MRTIVYANALPFIALLASMIMINHNHLFDKRQSRLFRLAICITLFMLVIISLDFVFARELAELPHVWIFRRITSCLNFAASPFVPLFLYQIFSGEQFKARAYLPCILNGALCVASMFWKLVFEISPTNGYDRGIFFFVPFLTSILYLGALIVKMGTFGRRGKTSERIYLTSVIAVLVFCMWLEIVQRYAFLSWNCAAVSIILYYMLLNINNSNADPLTGAYNRAMYMRALSEIDRCLTCTVAFLDINDFKLVNDLQGHSAGDQHLIRFVSILHSEIERGTALYRIGGDEFAVISRKWDEYTMRARLNSAREKARQVNIDFAYGIAAYTPDGVLEATLQLADQSMYQHKKKMKERAAGTCI